MKLTAVEWLNEQMNNIKGSSISMNGRVQFIEKELNNLLDQAKAMEKEQMEDIYIGHNQYNDEYETFEEYYNETFKSE